MIEEDNILISKHNLLDLRDLAVTYFKLSKSENKIIREKSEKLLIETLDSMEKAHKGEIMTPDKYNRKILDLFGGEAKATEMINEAKNRREKLNQKKSDK